MAGTTQVGRAENSYYSGEAMHRLEYNKMVIDGSTLLLNSGGLAIKAGSSALAKTVNTVDYLVNGVLCTKAAGDMAALAGTITNGNFGGWVFTINAAGTVASRFMTQGATLAAIVMPAVPATDAIIGMVRLNPTTADFVGGTTALDAANTNAIYRDTPFSARGALSTGSGVAAQVTSPVGA
jgi:hypothetical protein